MSDYTVYIKLEDLLTYIQERKREIGYIRRASATTKDPLSIVYEGKMLELEKLEKEINNLPKTRRIKEDYAIWEVKKSFWVPSVYTCSKCKVEFQTTREGLKYCPACGRRMIKKRLLVK